MSWGRPKWVRALPTGLVVNVATLGWIGRKLPAPGTWGSLVGTLFCAWVLPRQNADFLSIGLELVALYFAVGFCGEAEVRMKARDPGSVILDEFFAMPLCFLGWGNLLAIAPAWMVLAAGFSLFRLFDILKPFGISRLQKLPEGWGVVVDDAAAALVACAILHGGAFLWLHFHA